MVILKPVLYFCDITLSIKKTAGHNSHQTRLLKGCYFPNIHIRATFDCLQYNSHKVSLDLGVANMKSCQSRSEIRDFPDLI